MGWNVRLSPPVILATKRGQAGPRLATGEAKATLRPEDSGAVGGDCAMAVIRGKRWAVRRAGPAHREEGDDNRVGWGEVDGMMGIWSRRLPEALGRGWILAGPQAKVPWGRAQSSGLGLARAPTTLFIFELLPPQNPR